MQRENTGGNGRLISYNQSIYCMKWSTNSRNSKAQASLSIMLKNLIINVIITVIILYQNGNNTMSLHSDN